MLIQGYFLLQSIVEKITRLTGIAFKFPSQNLFSPNSFLDVLRWIDQSLDGCLKLKGKLSGEEGEEGEGDSTGDHE